MDDLLRAGAHVARRAVIMATPNNGSKSRRTGSSGSATGGSTDSDGGDASVAMAAREMQLLADADTIFIYSALHTLNPDLHVVAELVHHANIQCVL